VTDAAAVAAAARQVAEAIEPAGLAGLVNNAGTVVVGPLEIVPIEDFRKVFEVNVVGPLAMIQAFLPLLRAGGGRIVNMGSFNGLLAPPYFGPYAASKFALEAISDSLRVELRRWGISVCVVEPCSVRTPIWQKSHRAAEQMTASVPAEKMGLYQEDAEALRRAALELEQGAMPVETVVRAVRHALCARRPKTRYPVGVGAHLARWLGRTSPDRLRDWVLRKGMGMK